MNEEKKLEYSAQAQALVDEMPAFDRADFEKWYLENVIRKVGGSFIIAYITEKHQQKKNPEGG